MPAEEADRCWICLGGEGDAPPLASLTDSRHLIQVCACSLRAHKRCLLDWATDIDSRRRREGRLGEVLNELEVIHLELHGADDAAAVVGFRATDGCKIYTGTDVQCPQCKRQILLRMKPSSVLSLHNMVKSIGRNVATTSLTAIVGSTFIASVGFSIFSLLASLGFKMWSRLAGDGMYLRLLGLKELNFESALRKDSITMKNLVQTAGLPLFLHGLRLTNRLNGFDALYPLLFLKNIHDYKGPKTFLSIFALTKFIYREFIFPFAFNLRYYRWLVETKPCFIADRLSQEELEQMETDKIARSELDQSINEKYNAQEAEISDLPWFKRLVSRRVVIPTPEERTLRDKLLQREIDAIISRDYSAVFHREGLPYRFATTCFWPFAGSYIGDILGKFTPINRLLLPVIDTPAEGTYGRNLIGMCIVALIRDVVLCYIAWKEVQQYKNLDVIDSEFNGLKVNCITSVHVEPGEELPEGVFEDHMRQHDPADVQRAEQGAMPLLLGSTWAQMPNLNQLVNMGIWEA